MVKRVTDVYVQSDGCTVDLTDGREGLEWCQGQQVVLLGDCGSRRRLAHTVVVLTSLPTTTAAADRGRLLQ